jgi:predicted nucleic acid-binding protein
MIATVFVDTNVLLYALDRADLKKQERARAWRTELWERRCGRISVQVLQEFYANVVRKWPSTLELARSEIRNLQAWRPVTVDIELLEHGWRIQDRYQLSFWDALIVAAAKSSESTYLLTEDLQAGQELDGITVIDPFQTLPTSLLS